jgi:hypothetical protein
VAQTPGALGCRRVRCSLKSTADAGKGS